MKQRNRGMRSLIIATIVAVFAIGGSAAYWHIHTHAAKSVTVRNGQSASDSINFKPPTAQDKQYNDQQKNNLAQPQQTPAKSSDGRQAVTPIISSASSSSIHAYVPGIFENGGTCTATLTNGSQTITKTSAGFENASYTQCTPIDLSSTNLNGQTWTITVTYSSPTATGTSQSMSINE